MTQSTSTAGLYMLASEHASAVQRFVSDPTLATMLHIPNVGAPTAGADAIARTTAERIEGKSYWHAVVDRGDVKGLAAVIDPYSETPEIQVWIDPAARRHGYGELATRMVLELAFRNLQLRQVHLFAAAGDPAVQRLFEKFGFLSAALSDDRRPDILHLTLTRPDWLAARDKPAIAKLHPALRTILDAELAAGNEVTETGGGWPDVDSVFVRLRDPFRTKPASLPPGVVYTEPNDTHWWKADYSSASPRHILAC